MSRPFWDDAVRFTEWYVFQDVGTASVTRHQSYRDAVFEAQSRGCTEERPKRVRAGFYQVAGTSGRIYYVGTLAAMEQQGYKGFAKRATGKVVTLKNHYSSTT